MLPARRKTSGSAALLLFAVLALIVAGVASAVGFVMYTRCDELKNQMAETEEEKEIRVLALEQKVQKKEKEAETAEEKLEKAREDLAGLTAQVSELEAEAKIREKEMEDQGEKIKELEEREKLAGTEAEAKLEVVEEKLKKSEIELEVLKKENERLKKNPSGDPKREAELEKKIEDLEDEVEDKEKELEAKKEQIANLKTDAGAASAGASEEVTSLKSELATRQKEIEEREEALKSKEEALKEKDELLKKKDEEIAALKESSKEKSEGSSETLTVLKERLSEKKLEADKLAEEKKTVQEKNLKLEDEKSELTEEKTLLQEEIEALRESMESPDTSKAPEHLRIGASVVKASADFSARASTATTPAGRIDPEDFAGISTDAAVGGAELVALGRFGFMLDYSFYWTKGKETLSSQATFEDVVFEAGNELDADFMLHQITGGLLIGLGAVKKTAQSRADLSLVLGWREAILYANLLDVDDDETVEETKTGGFPFIGFRLDYMIQKDFNASVQLLGNAFKYDKYELDAFLEPKLTMNIVLTDNIELQLGYKYTLLRYGVNDEDSGTHDEINFSAEGPVIGITGRF